MYIYILHFIFNYQTLVYYLLHTKYTYVNNFIFTIKSKYIKYTHMHLYY